MVVVEGDEGVVGTGQALRTVTVVCRARYLVSIIITLKTSREAGRKLPDCELVTAGETGS